MLVGSGAAHYLLHGAHCLLHGAHCLLHGADCLLHGADCLLHGAALLQALAENQDDAYSSSAWADPKSLKQQFTGLGGIRVPR